MADKPSLDDLFPEGDTPECKCCRSKSVPLSVFRSDKLLTGKREYEYKMLCKICSGTLIGIWDEYPQQHDGDALEMMKMIAFVGNELLKAVREESNNG